MKIYFSHKEELWNSWSHGGGILLGVVVGSIFLYMCFSHGNGWATAGVILYLVGMLFSYVASTVYHALKGGTKWKAKLRNWDHAAIYWHIAGSYITGAVFYSINKKRFMHTVFHFFVLAGSICHIIAVWGMLIQYL
jgi:predicted membrane channel-forming protein YqfA (hemolysin III family)